MVLNGSTINNHGQYSLLKKQCLKIIIWQSGFFSDQNSDQNSNLNSWRILLPSASPTGFFANSRSNIESSLYCKLFATFLQCKHCRKPHCRNGVVDTFGHWFSLNHLTLWSRKTCDSQGQSLFEQLHPVNFLGVVSWRTWDNFSRLVTFLRSLKLKGVTKGSLTQFMRFMV